MRVEGSKYIQTDQDWIGRKRVVHMNEVYQFPACSIITNQGFYRGIVVIDPSNNSCVTLHCHHSSEMPRRECELWGRDRKFAQKQGEVRR